jgi:hypothetical protein
MPNRIQRPHDGSWRSQRTLEARQATHGRGSPAFGSTTRPSTVPPPLSTAPPLPSSLAPKRRWLAGADGGVFLSASDSTVVCWARAAMCCSWPVAPAAGEPMRGRLLVRGDGSAQVGWMEVRGERVVAVEDQGMVSKRGELVGWCCGHRLAHLRNVAREVRWRIIHPC